MNNYIEYAYLRSEYTPTPLYYTRCKTIHCYKYHGTILVHVRQMRCIRFDRRSASVYFLRGPRVIIGMHSPMRGR